MGNLYLYDSRTWSEYYSAKDKPVAFESLGWDEASDELDKLLCVFVIKMPFTFFAQVPIGPNGRAWTDRGHLMVEETCGPFKATYDVDMASSHAKCYINQTMKWLVIWLK